MHLQDLGWKKSESSCCAQVDAAALAEVKAERDVANRKVESLQMTLTALKEDHERAKGAEASLRAARANLKDREEKLRAMSRQLEAARLAINACPQLPKSAQRRISVVRQDMVPDASCEDWRPLFL